MAERTFKVTLADGTQLGGLGLNRNNSVSKKKVTGNNYQHKEVKE